jgi:DNA-binding NarL/FixJ family response regulator
MSLALVCVLLADNQPIFRAALAGLMSNRRKIKTVIGVGDWGAALAALRHKPPIQLAIVDLDLHGMARIDGVRHLRTAFPAMLVLVLSATHDRRVVLEVMAAGAHGYLTRDSDAATVEAAIDTILAGNLSLPAFVADLSIAHTDATTTSEAHLTERQREVLDLIAAGQSNKEIGRTLHIAEGTVKIHVTAAFRQLGVHTRADATHLFNGYAPLSSDAASKDRELRAADWRPTTALVEPRRGNGAAQ